MPAVAAAAAAGSSTPATAAPSPKAKMKIGHQVADPETLKMVSCWGVKNICSNLPSRKYDENWSVESLSKLKESIGKYGIALDMVPLPMSSQYITKFETPSIMLGTPERDKDIENICNMLRNCAKVGIPAVKYNLTYLGVVRTEATQGRGAAKYSTFKFADAKQDPPLTEAGRIDPDTYWERVDYFLKRVVPVAAENKVRLCLHPQDPGMPHKEGYRGINTVIGSVDGMKKFVSMHENPYHGFNFCQGTVSEMLEKPGEQIYDVIRYFGQRKKIFNVHFRNIQGRFLDFRETFPDDGDINMLKAMRVYKEVGYEYMIMPDHVPRIEGDAGGHRAFAFEFGYIAAAIQMVRDEA